MTAAELPGVGAHPPAETGVAIECATERVDVLVSGPGGVESARVVESVEHGHTRRVTPLLAKALERAGVAPDRLAWIAVDLGPGSFTGVRVGLATAEALSLATGARVRGASSLASLALGAPPQRGLLVPLVPAGRNDVYAGFFRGDGRGAGRACCTSRPCSRRSRR